VFLFAFVADFFFFAAASTSNALRTSESLNAEKAKLEARKEKLEDELEAGVSEALEVAIRQQIAGIYTRIAPVQADITAIRTQITASINAPSKTSRATDVEMPPGTTCGIVCLFSGADLLLPQSTWAGSRSSSGSSSSRPSTRLSPCQ
jgi:hypothetical protein